MSGRALPLIFLVIRQHVARGCPSTEPSPSQECFRTQPACGEKARLRGRKRGSDGASAEAPGPRTKCFPKNIAPQEVCGAAPGCDQHPKLSQPRRFDEDGSLTVIGRPPRPRGAFVCPLDNGGLRGVSRSSVNLRIFVPPTSTVDRPAPVLHG